MRRKSIFSTPPEYPEPEDRQENRITKEFRFELITPMCGGDAESWELDLERPVREPSVKGQLRFWWRAMQGHTDYQKLLYEENRIFGGNTENGRIKSEVLISIKDTHVEKKELAVNCKSVPEYVSFPIRNRDNENSNKNSDKIYFIEKMNFTLQAVYPRHVEKQIIQALTLWTLFGGAGARTRRGTGSLYCEELLGEFGSDVDIMNYIRGVSSGDDTPIKYSRLKNCRLYARETGGEPANAWKDLLADYGGYRQKRRKKEIGGRAKPYGRSYWPEPDAMRRIFKAHSGGHEPSHPDGIWFPRAAFGLPVLTRFKDANRGDPGDEKGFLLKPNIEKSDRFPSPVWLKVIRLPNGKIYQCALVLNQEYPSSLRLDWVTKGKGKAGYDLKKSEMPFHSPASGPKIMCDVNGFKLNQPATPENIYGHLAEALGLRKVT